MEASYDMASGSSQMSWALRPTPPPSAHLRWWKAIGNDENYDRHFT